MEVVVSNSITITLETSQTHQIPFTIFDKFAADMHIAVLYAFAPPNPTNSAIKQGLSEALQHFPTLASRAGEDERHRQCLYVGGEGGGLLVVEATVASDLADHIPIQPSPQLLLLHPSVEEPTHLVQVQLNRFRCGGLVIGVTAHHWVADGQSMSTFFIAWGKLIRGVGLDRMPDFDRNWLRPRQPPRPEFQHWGVEFITRSQAHPTESPSSSSSSSSNSIPYGKLCNVSLHYSWEFITSELKAHIMPEKYTTFETLLGHVWRKITVARGVNKEEFTQIRVAVNGRPRLRPRIPPEFFGNLVLNAYPRARVKDLLGGGVAGAARLIQEAIRRIDAEYFRSFIDFGALHEDEDLVPYYDVEEAYLCPNLEADSWLGFPFQELDLGGGGLCAFVPTWITLEGVFIFVPSVGRDEGSGVNVIITLFEEHARLLKQISHSLE